MSNNTPSSPVSPLWRKMLGVVLGISAAVTVILILQSLGHKMWPMPEGVDFKDKEAIAALIRSLPAAALLWVALSYFGGTLAGAYMALRVSRDPWTTWPAVSVEAVLLALGVMNLMALPHPGWFWVVALASFPLGAFLAIWLARRGQTVG
jgi:hypothetical protein